MSETVFDIEAPGLDPDSLHVIGVKEGTGLTQLFYDKPLDTDQYQPTGSLQEGVEAIVGPSNTYIGHNILGFDYPVINKLYNRVPHESSKIRDTMVMSYLLNPDRGRPEGYAGKGGPHSLEAWGYRVGRHKPEHEDWSVLTPAMLRRNFEDVEVNSLVYTSLQRELKGHNWERSLDIEHEVQRIESEKEKNGVNFDKLLSNVLLSELQRKIDKASETLLEVVPKKVKPKGVSIIKPFTVKGTLIKRVVDWYGDDSSLVSGPFSKIEIECINLNSHAQVKEYLFSIGWVPDEWNYKDGQRTSPKVTDSSLEKLTGPFVTEYKLRSQLTHRYNQLRGWVETLREKDQRITARAIACGTNTGRMRHIGVANVPKAKEYILYGINMRSVFRNTAGRILVGHDASGLELRMLSHYMDDPVYTDMVLNGDIHVYNQEKAGLPTRDDAKTFIYAFLYGAGDAKIGSIVGGGEKEGKEIKKAFFAEVPKLERLLKNVKQASKKGWLRGLDNRKVWMRRNDRGAIAENKALNTLLQSAGSIVMKQASINLDKAKELNNIDALKVIDYHDEQVNDVLLGQEDIFSELAIRSVVQSGIDFNLRIPLAAEAKIGYSWAEVH